MLNTFYFQYCQFCLVVKTRLGRSGVQYMSSRRYVYLNHSLFFGFKSDDSWKYAFVGNVSYFHLETLSNSAN